jgi:hypothetical protein
VQAKISWAPTDDEALGIAHEQWRTNVFPSIVMADLEQVAQFEEVAAFVRPEDMHASVLVSSDLGRFRGWLQELLDLEIDNLIIHHMGKEQRPFIDAFGADVIPHLKR